MSYNLSSSYDVDKISLGRSIVYIGSVGFTPAIDIGAVEDVSIETSTDHVDITQGEPSTIVERYIKANSARISVKSLEWNLDRMSDALAAGLVTYDISADTISLKFGGEITTDKVSLMFVHQTPSGDTVEVYIWKAVGEGSITIGFTEDIHSFDYTFSALDSETSWSNESLTSVGRLYEIVYYE